MRTSLSRKSLRFWYIYFVLRRNAVAVLLGTLGVGEARARVTLDRFMGTAQGTALVLDVRNRRLIAAHRIAATASELAPPGSTLKPFVLSALLLRSRGSKLDPDVLFHCPGTLRVGDRSFDCSHPRVIEGLRVCDAIAYSCNCFVAHFASWFEPGELALSLRQAGLGSLPGISGMAEVSGRIPDADGAEQNQLQALGEEPLVVTPAALAIGYRRLALAAAHPVMAPVIQGLEEAAEYGTARLAAIEGVRIAGKTGSVRTSAGAFIAWFAGFVPSRAPEIVVTVMIHGKSGGADAAPIAGRIFRAWRTGKL